MSASAAGQETLHHHARARRGDGQTPGLLRLHERNAKAYLTGKTVAERFHYDYSDVEIAEVSERALALAEQADGVHVVSNNNSRDFASVAAERLSGKLGQGGKMPERA